MDHIIHNYVRVLAVDVMHCIFEGVVKNLLNFCLSLQMSDHPSSIVQHMNLVDHRLKSLTPPSFVQRLPRSIKNHLPYWKAIPYYHTLLHTLHLRSIGRRIF